MKLFFTGDIEELRPGIELVKGRLLFEEAQDGLRVEVQKETEDRMELSFDGLSGTIRHGSKIQFFRALGLFVENLKRKEPFHIQETPSFKTNGAMVDVSRNAVLTVPSIKRLLEAMALMGLNLLMLYTEDTYEIKELPYFGYMRGRYSFDELKECDDYAFLLGVEMVPCIQTLAHLTQALKWNELEAVRDTGDILLVGEEKTYKLIELMIKRASAPFKSRRIHIGMDEAHSLGFGRYLDKNGFKRRFDIMNEHLLKVVGIAENQGLKPIIWSDMFFTLASKSGQYFDLDSEVPKDVTEAIPKNVQQVYWDYYHNDEDYYSRFIQKHRDMGIEPLFAGGIWSFAGLMVNYEKTFVSTKAALSACRKQGVKEVIATIWNDDGAETNLFTCLLGLQLFAEEGYSLKTQREFLEERFKTCTGGNPMSFMELSGFDTLPGSDKESIMEKPTNPSKYLLWQDLLSGLFDRHIDGVDTEKHYKLLGEEMKQFASEDNEWSYLFEMPYRLCEVLSVKGRLGIKLRTLYLKKDRNELRSMVDETLPHLFNCVDQLRKAHRELWFKTCKPFGWEVLDIRYGGLMARIESTCARIRDYCEGRTDTIEELEEERLYYDGPVRPNGAQLGRCNQYRRIVSASSMV